MAGFGGAVKLTGESEYRQALAQITQNLREVSSQMNVVSSAYAKNDNSLEALSSKETVLNSKLQEQSNKLKILQAQKLLLLMTLLRLVIILCMDLCFFMIYL